MSTLLLGFSFHVLEVFVGIFMFSIRAIAYRHIDVQSHMCIIEKSCYLYVQMCNCTCMSKSEPMPFVHEVAYMCAIAYVCVI
jgi:hypothetical protein